MIVPRATSISGMSTVPGAIFFDTTTGKFRGYVSDTVGWQNLN